MTDTLKQLDSEARRLLGISFRDLSPEERHVVEKLVRRTTVSRRRVVADEEESFGSRLADQVAAVGGSWGFIIGFGAVLFTWILANSVVLLAIGRHPFDLYPYIFLNLLLSMLAALQAPVIMMSQNRQAAKDRAAAQHDYEVNLKCELEIMGLHEKLDALRTREVAELLTQQIRMLKSLGADGGVDAAPAGSPA